MNNNETTVETTTSSLTIGNTVLYAVSRNYLNPGDWIETNDGTFAKVEKLEYREVYTDKGVIKKLDIKQVYVPANGALRPDSFVQFGNRSTNFQLKIKVQNGR